MFALRSSITKASFQGVAAYSTSMKKEGVKVAVLGAAGGIGQPLSMLLKLNPNIRELSLYDIVNTPGVAADLSHIPTDAKVTGYVKDNIDAALQGCDIVVIPAGVPRKPGMTRDDLFNTNASIVMTLAKACAKNCPEAALAIISNPVNSTVPIVAETFKKAGVYNPRKLFGVTTLDVLRARTFLAENGNVSTKGMDVPVVGGHAGKTILPLISQNTAGVKPSAEDIEKLTHRIQFGGDEVVKAKDGAGSATLSMAQAGAQFTDSLARALMGEKNIVECAFVESTVTSSPFFASKVTLGTEGVETIHGLGDITEFEKQKLEELLPELEASIVKGAKFANEN